MWVPQVRFRSIKTCFSDRPKGPSKDPGLYLLYLITESAYLGPKGVIKGPLFDSVQVCLIHIIRRIKWESCKQLRKVE